MNRLVEIFLTALKLGLTSFGGPTAHLGYFRKEYVETRQWLSDKTYQDIVALCQFLPGPASSQVGMAIGMIRGGVAGGLLAFLGFTLPSVLLLITAAYFMSAESFSISWIQGLKLVAVVVIFDALLGMSRTSLKNKRAVSFAVISFIVALTIASIWTQISIIIVSGIIGSRLFTASKAETIEAIPVSKKLGVISLTLLVLLAVLLPIMALVSQNSMWEIIDILFRSGLFVFGGGHVVLPLLEQSFVPEYVTDQSFIAGYGLTQAVPGPLFTFASYLGAVMNGFMGGLLAMAAIFLPAFLLVLGCLPFWKDISSSRTMRNALLGINASVIGILAAAWVNPVILHTITDVKDLLIALLLLVVFKYFKLAPWLLVLFGFAAGLLFYR